MLLRSFAAASFAVFALSGVAAASPLTADDFVQVTAATVAQFKADYPAHVDHFYGVNLTRNIQDGEEIGVLAKVYVKHTDTDSPMVMGKYNCQKSGDGSIECHPG